MDKLIVYGVFYHALDQEGYDRTLNEEDIYFDKQVAEQRAEALNNSCGYRPYSTRFFGVQPVTIR